MISKCKVINDCILYEHNGLGTGCNSGYNSKIKKYEQKTSLVRDTLITVFLSDNQAYFKFPILVNQQILLRDSLNLLSLNDKINKIAKSEIKKNLLKHFESRMQ